MRDECHGAGARTGAGRWRSSDPQLRLYLAYACHERVGSESLLRCLPLEVIELPKERSDAPQLRATAASSVQPQPPTESDGGTKAMQLIRGVAARAIEYIYRPRAAGARAMHYYIDLVSTYPTFRPKYNRPGVN